MTTEKTLPLNKQLEAYRKGAEVSIQNTLQDFHDITGLIPQSISFEVINVTDIQERAKGIKKVIIENVNFEAST